MTNANVGILMALLVVLSSGPTQARVAALAGESQPVPLWSRSATSPEQEWSSPRPAAKAQADDSISPTVSVGRTHWYWHPYMIGGLSDETTPRCSRSEVASLNGDDLVNYLRTHTPECIERLPIIYSDQNMQSVLAAIEDLATAYNGTNNTGLYQLWYFVWIGYWFHESYPDEIGGPFGEMTHRAYIAASEAFAANDHFFDFNDEAGEILFAYMEVADRDGIRQFHLEQIKLVLSGMTPERMTNFFQEQAFWMTVRLIYEGLFRNDQGFIDVLAQDSEIVELLLQATQFGELPIDTLGLLATIPSIGEAAIAALTTFLMEQERLSNTFIIAADALEDKVDCTSLNICRDVLKRELHARVFPNTYRFDDGSLVFETPLDLNTVQTLYQAAKEVKAQFHRLLETDQPVPGAIDDVLHVKIYGSASEHRNFQGYLFDADLRRSYAAGYYENGTVYTYRANFPTEPREGIALEEKFRHEYVHYLADRFVPTGLYDDCLLTWFHEGLAEFLMGSTQAEGISVLRFHIEEIMGEEQDTGVGRFDPARIFKFCYTGWPPFKLRDYRYSGLFFHFMHQQRRTQLLELVGMVRSGDVSAYNAVIETWAGNTQLAADYSAFVDEQFANVDQLPYHPDYSVHLPDVDPQLYPPQTTTFHLPAHLTSDSPAEIETALQRINGELNLNCRTVATELSPRFGCSGTLSGESRSVESLSSSNQGEPSLFDLFATGQVAPLIGDRGPLNERLNTRLDSFIVAAVEDGEINNFEDMNCYFTNVGGWPPVADLYCEGPLRPMALARALVDSVQTGLPDSDQLQQNAPNPFNNQTVLSYFLHTPGPARLEVFSLTGQRVAVLRQGPQKAGYHRLRWNGRDDVGRPVASGMYLYRLVTDEGALTRKLMLLR